MFRTSVHRISYLRPLPNILLDPGADSLIQGQIHGMHKVDKESINQKALMQARHRRGERSFGGPRTGPPLSIERGQNKQREKKLFSDKTFVKRFAQRDGWDGLDWQLGESLESGGGRW